MNDLGCEHALCPICETQLHASAHIGFRGMLELDDVYCKFCGYIAPPNNED